MVFRYFRHLSLFVVNGLGRHPSLHQSLGFRGGWDGQQKITSAARAKLEPVAASRVQGGFRGHLRSVGLSRAVG